MKIIRHLFLIISLSLATLAWAQTVNINTADVETLTTLDGIGASKAQAIVAYRESNGAFESVEELVEVDGIGEKTLEKLKPELVVK